MQTTKLAFFCGVALLACSGRYESNKGDDPATGGSGINGSAGQGATTSTAGTASSAGSGGTVILLPPLVDDQACGVPKGQPAALPDAIGNYMMWWHRGRSRALAASLHARPAQLP